VLGDSSSLVLGIGGLRLRLGLVGLLGAGCAELVARFIVLSLTGEHEVARRAFRSRIRKWRPMLFVACGKNMWRFLFVAFLDALGRRRML